MSQVVVMNTQRIRVCGQESHSGKDREGGQGLIGSNDEADKRHVLEMRPWKARGMSYL